MFSKSIYGSEQITLTNGTEGISVLAFDWLTGNIYWGGVEYIYVAPVANMSKIVSLTMRTEAMYVRVP